MVCCNFVILLSKVESKWKSHENLKMMLAVLHHRDEIREIHPLLHLDKIVNERSPV